MTLAKTSASGLTRKRDAEQGYVLLVLLLSVSLLAIAAVTLAPNLTFQIKRDREAELLHRGTQYSRAIRLYARKNGRFPLSIQELYDPNGPKYIRKLYKDPITGRDFRLLHTADVMTFAAGMAPNNSSFQAAGSQDGSSPDADPGTANPGTANPGSALAAPDAGSSTTPGLQPDAQPSGSPSGAVPSSGVGSSKPPLTPDDPTKGIIFGVASTSKNRSIREFNHKSRYDQWLFFYDINNDRGHLITAPTSLGLPSAPPVGQPAAGLAQQPAAQPALQ